MLQDGDKGAIIQRDKETYAISPHATCGLTSPEELRKIADVAEKYGAQQLKFTSASRIAIIGLKEEDIDKVWAELGFNPGHAIGLCIRSVKACPGTTFCKKGMKDSLALGQLLDKKYHGMEVPGKLKFAVSGCPNQCAENAIKDVSLWATKKGWQLMVGGNGGGKPRLAKLVAQNLTEEKALELFDKCVQIYLEKAKIHQRFGLMLERNFEDFEDFRKLVLGDDYYEIKKK